MAGAARYQGIDLVSFELSRARGFGASFARVQLWVKGFPGGVQVQVPAVDDEPPALPPAGDAGRCLEVAQAAARGAELGPIPLPGVIPWAGWLSWAEAEGELWSGEAGPYYLTDVVEIQRSGDGSLSLLQLTLADARWRHGAGVLRRWSFNRLGVGQERVRDSLRPDGSDWTQDAILSELCASQRGGPRLARAPARLQVSAGPREFPAYGSALQAFGDEVLRYGLEDPCLAWGGAGSTLLDAASFGAAGQAVVAMELYDPGERAEAGGVVGVRPEDVPPQLALWLQGRGQGGERELGYPADHVVVRGGPRVATAAIDLWEAVLDLAGAVLPEAALAALGGQTYVPLNEETVRVLTGGQHGLTWLRRWILGDHGHVGAGITREVAALLEEQAWRLFRLPSARTADGRPGRNAHVLPLLPRAETDGDRRLPVQVQTYTYVPVHALYRGARDQRSSLLSAARATLAKIRKDIATRARTRNLRDPFGSQVFTLGVGTPLPGDAAPLSAALVRNLTAYLATEGLSDETLAQGVEIARALQRVSKGGDATLAGEYERALLAIYAQGEGDQDLALAAGKLIAQLEDALRDTSLFNAGLPLDALLRGKSADEIEALVGRIRDLALERKRRQQERARRLQSGQDQAQPDLVWVHENLPRRRDPGASVYDAEAGVIRTSRLAGWLENPSVGPEGVTDTAFVPKPVRVLFGCQVRPRRDLLPGETPRPVTQADRPDDALDDVIPTGLTDRDSWYVQAFRREGQTPVPEAATESVLARALSVTAPWLVELLPLGLVAAANALELQRAAYELAQGPMQRRPLVAADRATFARPWRVRLDGAVAQVVIRSRPNMAGFVTEVTTGTSERAIDPYRTRERPKVPLAGRGDDARTREGTR